MDITDPEHPEFDLKAAIVRDLLESPPMPKPEMEAHFRVDYGLSEPPALVRDLAAIQEKSANLSAESCLNLVVEVFAAHGNAHLLDDEPSDLLAPTL